MAQPTEKTWGNWNLSAIEDIQQNRRHLINEYTNPKTGETIRQIKVNGAKWDSGNWTYQVWDGQAKEAITVAYLNPDEGFKSAGGSAKKAIKKVMQEDDDMPF
jgi:hypothetical protein